MALATRRNLPSDGLYHVVKFKLDTPLPHLFEAFVNGDLEAEVVLDIRLSPDIADRKPKPEDVKQASEFRRALLQKKPISTHEEILIAFLSLIEGEKESAYRYSRPHTVADPKNSNLLISTAMRIMAKANAHDLLYEIELFGQQRFDPWLVKSAELGNPCANYEIDRIEMAAVQGHPLAQYQLAKDCYKKQDYLAYLKLLFAAASSGHVKAITELQNLSFKDFTPYLSAIEEARVWHERLAGLGNIRSQYYSAAILKDELNFGGAATWLSKVIKPARVKYPRISQAAENELKMLNGFYLDDVMVQYRHLQVYVDQLLPDRQIKDIKELNDLIRKKFHEFVSATEEEDLATLERLLEPSIFLAVVQYRDLQIINRMQTIYFYCLDEQCLPLARLILAYEFGDGCLNLSARQVQCQLSAGIAMTQFRRDIATNPWGLTLNRPKAFLSTTFIGKWFGLPRKVTSDSGDAKVVPRLAARVWDVSQDTSCMLSHTQVRENVSKLIADAEAEEAKKNKNRVAFSQPLSRLNLMFLYRHQVQTIQVFDGTKSSADFKEEPKDEAQVFINNVTAFKNYLMSTWPEFAKGTLHSWYNKIIEKLHALELTFNSHAEIKATPERIAQVKTDFVNVVKAYRTHLFERNFMLKVVGLCQFLSVSYEEIQKDLTYEQFAIAQLAPVKEKELPKVAIKAV